MLSKVERLAIISAIEHVQQKTVYSLRRLNSAEQTINFISTLHHRVNEVAINSAKSGPKPECRAGCAYCCSVRVEATEPEVFLIARKIKEYPKDEYESIFNALRSRREQNSPGNTHTMRQRCAFLRNNLCTIYDVRPATCRKGHSLSAAACESGLAEIPQDLQLLLQVEALMAGTTKGFRELGLHASPHELLGAVYIALTDESAESRWYAGETVFQS